MSILSAMTKSLGERDWRHRPLLLTPNGRSNVSLAEYVAMIWLTTAILFMASRLLATPRGS